MTETDPGRYRAMWVALFQKLATYRSDNLARAILSKDMTELAKTQGAEEAYGIVDAIMAQVEKETGVNPFGRPPSEEILDA